MIGADDSYVEETASGPDSFGLKDFLSFAGSAYSTYANLETTSDAARIAQANAAQQNTQLVSQNNQAEQIKKYLMIGGAVILGVVALLVVVKILRR